APSLAHQRIHSITEYLSLHNLLQFQPSRITIQVFAKMSSTSRAWIAAASIGAVEALKDQGICRWNYTARSVVQHAKNHVRSASQVKNLSSQSSAAISKGLLQSKQSEESLRTVMYLSCWGPN
ncbi:hypothetical protein Goklo_016721, partial [Gossypium klotzschianum]|nr:hypothetical protein [Gossypium klotzschianum]